MGGGGHEIGERDRIRMKTRTHQAGNVGHVHHQVGADTFCNLTKTLKIDDPGICARPGYYELRPFLAGHPLDLVVVDLLRVSPYSIRDDPEKTAGKTHRTSVSEMPTLAQIHSEYSIARLEHSEKHGHIRLRARMRLNVYIVGMKQLLGAVLRQLLRNVNIFTTAIIPFPGVSFSVFVGQNGPLSFPYRPADKIFGCDQLQATPLAFFLLLNNLCYFRIDLLQVRHSFSSKNSILK